MKPVVLRADGQGERWAEGDDSASSSAPALSSGSTGAVGVTATLALIAEARHRLAEARALPDVRQVIEAATVAATAAQRATKLAEAQRLASDVVEAASEAANDAAAIRNEAQAKAGEMLLEMRERGRLAERGRPGVKRSTAGTFSPALDEDHGDPGSGPHSAVAKLANLGISKNESSRWQKVAGVPPAVRQEYVDATKAAKREVSTAGLLRYARSRTSGGVSGTQADAFRQRAGRGSLGPLEEQEALRGIVQGAHREVTRAADLRKYDAWLLVEKLDRRQRRQLRSSVTTLVKWLDEVMQALDSREGNEEVR